MFVLSIKKACGAKVLESQIIGQLRACDQNLQNQQDKWLISTIWPKNNHTWFENSQIFLTGVKKCETLGCVTLSNGVNAVFKIKEDHKLFGKM